MVPQSTTNPTHRFPSKLTEKPIYLSFPDANSVIFQPRRLDFSKKEITPKPNVATRYLS